MQFRNASNFILCAVATYAFLKYVPASYDVFAVFSVSFTGMKLAEYLMTITRRYFLYNTVCAENKAILITGCDTGFGNSLARRMDKLGYKVFASCLNPEGTSARDLKLDCSEKLTVLPLDVTSDQSVQEAKEFITRNLGSYDLWAVVNNAGIGHFGQIDWTSLKELQTVIDVNAVGPLRVIKAFLPFIKKSKGRIVNNNSLAGRGSYPAFTGYCMSKSAAISLTTGLRIELAKWGVKSISIEPFFYSTPLTGIENAPKLFDKSWKNAPEDVREEYGEEYKEAFKNRALQCLRRFSSPRISDVIDCLEDAITAEEPLSNYFPSEFIFKVGAALNMQLPSTAYDLLQITYAEPRLKPAALGQKKYR